MIITLGIIGLLIVGIICLVVSSCYYKCPDFVFCIGVILVVAMVFALIIVGMLIVSENINKDIDYQNKLYEKEMIEYRIENMNENIVGNEMLYNDIVEFNNSIRNTKKWANNPWTSWFYNEHIASIDYIELKDN